MTRKARLTEDEAIGTALAMLEAGQSRAEAEAFIIAWVNAGHRGGRNKLPSEALWLAANFCRLEIAAGKLLKSGKFKRDKDREARMLDYMKREGYDPTELPLAAFETILRTGILAAKAQSELVTRAERRAAIIAKAKAILDRS